MDLSAVNPEIDDQGAELEGRIADLFAAVLRTDGVGRDDGFFELGGDSLLMTEVVARLAAETGVTLPLDILLGAPTPATMARAIERVRETASEYAFPPLVPQPRTAQTPVSVSQEQICFLSELDLSSVAYQFQAIVWFNGELDVPALERALNEIVARHEIYRTTFPHQGGDWIAEVHDPFSVSLQVDDLSRAPDPEAALGQLAGAQFRRRLAIDELPLVRWRLVRVTPTRHALLHQEHHLVHDGWSVMVLVRELREGYAAAVSGAAPSLDPLPIQYRDFAAWQRALMETEVAERQLAYWRERLADPPDPPELPYDRPRPARQTYNGDRIKIEIPAELEERLREFSRAEGVTPFVTMLAAFFALLQRYSDAGDLIVGSGLANRRLRELDGLLGMFINTAALRVDVADDPAVGELLARVRAAVLGAQANQDVPFPRVVEAVAPARSSSHAPLYQTLFSVADAPLPELSAPGLEIWPDETPPNGSAKADINVVVINHEGPHEVATAPTIMWEYNCDLFSPATAERMAADYLRLLDSLIADPGRRVSALRLLGDAERRRLLVDWNDTAAEYPRDSSIAACFAEAARRDPDSVAVVGDDESLTYSELDRRSNQLARYLRARGTSTGSRVGVSLERSVEAVVAILGILKAGGAYVPLAPGDPAERRDFVIRDAGISLSLDSEFLSDPAIWTESDEEVGSLPAATDDGYVMYTSGSTGEPKGVLVTNRNVVRLVMAQSYAEFGPDQVFLQMAPLAFDASTFEIWGALLHGARLVLYPAGPIDLSELRATLERHGVTTLWLTAALFHHVVDMDVGALAGLRQLLAGGDVLQPDRVSRAMRALPGVKLVNGYGPTEATTFSCCFEASSGVPFEDSVPIGRPVANTTAYVLDRELEPTPVGVPGELYIGGDGIARGYLNRPELTAERFIPSPFGDDRLYRTGDTVRWRADGQLQFLGREDLQVKIRGFRVEPGEVEATLAGHPSIREVAVVAPADRNGDRRMVAYLAAEAGIDEADIRAFLAERLPSYMVPSEFTLLASLPVTPNGKTDRAALADRAAQAASAATSPSPAPRTEVEQAVAAIWCEVLGTDAAGPNDDFFLAGGHSLLAMKLVNDVNEACGVAVTVRSLLVKPTLGALAREVERARGGDGAGVPVPAPSADSPGEIGAPTSTPAAGHPPLVPIRPQGALPPLFLVAGGMGGEAELLVYARLARYLDPEQPFYGLRARGVDELVEPHESVEAMATEYVEQIRRVQPRGPYFISGSCVGGVVAYELAQQLRAAGEDVAALIVIDSHYPTRRRMLRNQLVSLWRDTLPPEVALSPGLSGTVKGVRARVRLLREPSEEQRLGLEKSRIGNRYLRRILDYRPQPYEGKLTVVACESREIEDAGRIWRDLAAGGFELRYVPGDHYTHLRDHAETTAACLDELLRYARA